MGVLPHGLKTGVPAHFSAHVGAPLRGHYICNNHPGHRLHVFYGLRAPFDDPTERTRQEMLEDFGPDQGNLHDLDSPQRPALVHHRRQASPSGSYDDRYPNPGARLAPPHAPSPAEAVAKALVASTSKICDLSLHTIG